MSIVNADKKFCYRITHIQNLPFILQNGMVNKHHGQADREYINIGNPEIIDVRSTASVRIEGYGKIGEYVPFYFTPKSMMLFNIVTGYKVPLVPKRSKSEILVIRCLIEKLTKLPQWFFTDGQGNDMTTHHYNDLKDIDSIDWENIQQSNFNKSDGDYDRPRRYQAEFLVRGEVPCSSIESLNVYNEAAATYVSNLLNEYTFDHLPVHIQPIYFF